MRRFAMVHGVSDFHSTLRSFFCLGIFNIVLKCPRCKINPASWCKTLITHPLKLPHVGAEEKTNSKSVRKKTQQKTKHHSCKRLESYKLPYDAICNAPKHEFCFVPCQISGNRSSKSKTFRNPEWFHCVFLEYHFFTLFCHRFKVRCNNRAGPMTKARGGGLYH